jgi:hypothetical protein
MKTKTRVAQGATRKAGNGTCSCGGFARCALCVARERSDLVCLRVVNWEGKAVKWRELPLAELFSEAGWRRVQEDARRAGFRSCFLELLPDPLTPLSPPAWWRQVEALALEAGR